MAQSSLPQAGNRNLNVTYVDAGPYTGDQWSDLFRILFTGDQHATQGVLRGMNNELAATNPAGLQIVTATGAGVADGHVFINTAIVTIVVDGGANRSDALCIVENNTNVAIPAGAATNYNTEGDVSIPPYSARLAVVKNVGANFSQTNVLYMVRLATFVTGVASISNLVDVRDFCAFASQADTENIADLAVTGAKIAADSVDDTKAGNRVPQFYRRQGGNATDWHTPGTTNYTPGAIRVQMGALVIPGTGVESVTFPVAFSAPPLVYVTNIYGGGVIVSAYVTTATYTALRATTYAGTLTGTTASWLAIGPE